MERPEWHAWAPFLILPEHLTNSLHVEQEGEFDCLGVDFWDGNVVEGVLAASEERGPRRYSHDELFETYKVDSCKIFDVASSAPKVLVSRLTSLASVEGSDVAKSSDPETRSKTVSGCKDFREAESIEAGLVLDGLAELLSMTRHTFPAVWRVK